MAQVKSNIIFIIFTYNEEKRIEYPIRCFLPYGEVIVSDDSSTDNTVKIAEKLGAKVIKRKTHLPFVENKEETEFIFSHVKTDWVFWGFADEIVPKKCLDLIKKISLETKYKIVVQKRKTMLYDPESEFVPVDVSVNFFRKDSLDFSTNTIHQMGKFASHVKPDEVLYLPPIDEYSVYHYSRYNTESIINNLNTYSSLHARSASEKLIGMKMIFFPTFTFLKIYFLEGAIRYGLKGLIVSIQYAIYFFMVYAKAYENSQNVTLDSIESKFAVSKKNILKKSPKTSLLKIYLSKIWILFISKIHKFYKFKQIK
ncbi:MAG: glycosyltransferase [Patescibacteria group bacterium]